jgi:outer membrane murein-binding lipoprotein Lpp
MKKTTLVFLFLVVISTMLIAGCTTTTVAIKPATTPAPTPAVTAVQTYVQNQQGVAIIKTVTATPTPAVQATQTGEVRIAQNVIVKPETVSNLTNKTEQIVSNVTNKTGQIIANLTK